MNYCLESKEESLTLYRSSSPMDEKAKAQIQRASVLRLREAILAHYEVNPFVLPIVEPPKKITFNVCLHAEKRQKNSSVKSRKLPFKFEKIPVKSLGQLMQLISLVQSGGNITSHIELLSACGFDRNALDFQTFVETADWNNYRLVDCFRRSHRGGEITYVDEKHLHEYIKKVDYVRLFASKGVALPEYMTQQAAAWEPPKLGKVDDVKAINFDKLSYSVLAALVTNGYAQAYKRANPKPKISDIINSSLMQKFIENCALAEGGEMKSEDRIREYIEHQFLTRKQNS